MFDLTGQVAVITGSSRGIGRATAECMARAGAKVVVSSRKPAACQAVADAIAASGGEALVVPCNVAEKEQLQNLIDQTVARFGRLDILVCNAAVNPYFGPMAKMPDEAYDKIMHSNVRSNFWLCNMAAPHMVASGGGQQGDFLHVLAAVAAAHDNVPVTKIGSLSFKPGELEMKVSGPDAASLELLNQALRAGGYQAEVASGSTSGAAFEGRILMRTQGS